MATSKKRYDDLTSIKGIGKKRQDWLREKMEIYRYADLAALSADVLETRLREDGQLVSGNAVQGWIDQAASLMVTDSGAGERDVQRAEQWQPFASFVVEYQMRGKADERQLRTKVHHVEADNEESWPSVVTDTLCQWMRDKAGIEAVAVEERVDEATVEATPVEATAVIEAVTDEDSDQPLQVKQIRVYQPPQADVPVAIGEPGRPFMGTVSADIPCALTVLFDISDQKALSTRDIVAQLYAHNLTTYNKVLLPVVAESKTRPHSNGSPAIEFASTALAAGAYRFEIIVRQNQPTSQISYLESSIVHAV